MLPARSRLRAAAATLAALATIAPAAQARAPHLTTFKLDARITGTQTVDWHYQSDGWPSDDRAWTLGRGTQKLDFATSTAFPMQLFDARVPGRRTTVLQSVALRQPELSGAVSRTQGWDHHVPPQCGGELGDCSTLQAPAEPSFDCATRQMTVRLTTLEGDSQKGQDIRAVLTPTTAKPFAACPPDQPGGAVADLQAGTIGPVTLDHTLADVARLRRGKAITLKGTARRGFTDKLTFRTTCPELKGPGFQACQTVDVEVRLRRR
jgi:hypothetical protein